MSRAFRYDPIRSSTGGRSAGIGAELQGIRGQAPSLGVLSRAVVIEVLNDPSLLTEEELASLSEELPGGISSLRRAPRNSLVARAVSGPGSTIQASNILCYPFFSPHLAVPIKPGEQVWVFNESPEGDVSNQYWMSRVPEPDFSDDINYTHPERRYGTFVDKVDVEGSLVSASGDDTQSEDARQFDGLKDAGRVPGPPSFSNGPPDEQTPPSLTLPASGGEGTGNAYDDIVAASRAYSLFTPEPVPRYTKRPGDLVLQGSNNALICLGQDRGWSLGQRPDGDASASSQAPRPFAGTVDIVAGRGRFYENTAPDQDSPEPPDTQPRVILNSRGVLEVDKNPAAFTKDAARRGVPWNRLDQPQEGDPDFLADASRIYVSMGTEGDRSFNLTPDVVTPLFEGELSAPDGPFVVLKSDELRLVARKEEERGNINGSIRLIKEGTVGEDYASIFLLPDGVVQVTGSKIYLGQPDQGAGPGEKGSEPYVKYSELEALLERLFDNINDFCQTMLTHTTPGYGAPSIQINQAVTTLQTEAATRKSEIVKLKSSRVFGE